MLDQRPEPVVGVHDTQRLGVLLDHALVRSAPWQRDGAITQPTADGAGPHITAREGHGDRDLFPAGAPDGDRCVHVRIGRASVDDGEFVAGRLGRNERLERVGAVDGCGVDRDEVVATPNPTARCERLPIQRPGVDPAHNRPVLAVTHSQPEVRLGRPRMIRLSRGERDKQQRKTDEKQHRVHPNTLPHLGDE